MNILTVPRVPRFYDQVYYQNGSGLFQVANFCEQVVSWMMIGRAIDRYWVFIQMAPLNKTQAKWKEIKRTDVYEPSWIVPCLKIIFLSMFISYSPVFFSPLLLALYYIRFKARQIAFQGYDAESFRRTETDFSRRIRQEADYRKKVSETISSKTGLPSVLANLVTSYISRADVFGRDAWNSYFGVDIVGAEPPLPKDIDRILKSPSNLNPLKPNNTVADDFMLVLIPKGFIQVVDGKEVQLPLTLKNCHELGENIKSQARMPNNIYYGYSTMYIGDITIGDSYWVLMSKEVLPGSQNRAYAAQEAHVATFSEQTGIPYEVPTVLESIISIVGEYARTGRLLRIFTRCKETHHGIHYGIFSYEHGLSILAIPDDHYRDECAYGIAVVRRLS